MADSERLAVAAHLHVALRRKVGRVTDVDWMAVDDTYAREILKLTLAKATELEDSGLAELGGKLQALLTQSATRKPAEPPLVERISRGLHTPAPARPSPEEDDGHRYVGGLR